MAVEKLGGLFYYIAAKKLDRYLLWYAVNSVNFF